jgi:chorismate mutase
MNNEFKKSKSNNETRYTLESMTAGATGSGSIATATGSSGKVQKRGNILAQEADKKKDGPKPRNFVAKNAKSGGAGAHKDKKKEQKQGAAKHKKPYMESLRTKIDQLKTKLAEHSVAEGVRDLGYDAQSLIMKLRRDVEEKRLQPTPQAVLAAARELAGDMEFAPQLLVKQVLGQGVAEGSLNEGKGLAGELAGFLKSNGFKGPYRLGKLPKWAADLSEFDKNSLIMVQGNDVEYDEFVVDIGYGILYWGAEGGMTKMTEKAIMNHVQQGAAEGVAEAPEDRTSYQVAKILADRGIKYDPAQENDLINAIGMVLVKELNMSPKQARHLISYDEDFVSDTLGELRSMEQSVSEVSPPGWEKTVKAMKKHGEIDNPFALAWSMKNKGYKSHKKESADPYFESLASKLDQIKKK